MNAGNGKLRVAAFFLGIAFLCGCAGPRTAAKPAEPVKDPVSVRLPVLTPLRIEQPSGPPVAEQSISQTDVEDGKARSLKMFQIDYDLGKQGPAVGENPPGSMDPDTTP